jgi:hypothetical protein
MLLKLRTILVTFLIALGVSSATELTAPQSVCDLLRSGQWVNGKTVSVRGILTTANPKALQAHFDELIGEGCDPAGGSIRIQVVSPDAHFLAEPPPGYKPDPDSVRRAERVAQAAADHHRALIATVEGILYVVEGAKPGIARHRRYPAVIVVGAIRDVKER